MQALLVVQPGGGRACAFGCDKPGGGEVVRGGGGGDAGGGAWYVVGVAGRLRGDAERGDVAAGIRRGGRGVGAVACVGGEREVAGVLLLLCGERGMPVKGGGDVRAVGGGGCFS